MVWIKGGGDFVAGKMNWCKTVVSSISRESRDRKAFINPRRFFKRKWFTPKKGKYIISREFLFPLKKLYFLHLNIEPVLAKLLSIFFTPSLILLLNPSWSSGSTWPHILSRFCSWFISSPCSRPTDICSKHFRCKLKYEISQQKVFHSSSGIYSYSSSGTTSSVPIPHILVLELRKVFLYLIL